MQIEKKPAFAVCAVIAVLAGVAVGVTLVAREDVPAELLASDPGLVLAPPPKAPFPPAPGAATVEPALAVEQEPALAVEGDRPALCEGCLSERAVLDVVETYLRHLDPVHLRGGIWAQPLRDVAETPDRVGGLPKLPAGLAGAPEQNPFGVTVDTRRYPVETTWLVWLQTGWLPRKSIEQRIRRVDETTVGELRANEPHNFAALQAALEEKAPGTVLTDDLVVQSPSGVLPEVALSWPPIKKETYVAIDSRTGELWPDGIFEMTTAGQWPPHPPHYEAVLDATRERAARWFGEAATN